MKLRKNYQLKEKCIVLLKWQSIVCTVFMSKFFRNLEVGLFWVLDKRGTKMILSLKNLLCGEKFFHCFLLGDMITRGKVFCLFMFFMLRTSKAKIQCWKSTHFCDVIQLILDLVDSASLEISESSACSPRYIQYSTSNAGVNAQRWLRNSFLHMGHCFIPKQRIGYWFSKSQTTAPVTCDSDQSDLRLCKCMNVLSSFLIINELTGSNMLKYF